MFGKKFTKKFLDYLCQGAGEIREGYSFDWLACASIRLCTCADKFFVLALFVTVLSRFIYILMCRVRVRGFHYTHFVHWTLGQERQKRSVSS